MLIDFVMQSVISMAVHVHYKLALLVSAVRNRGTKMIGPWGGGGGGAV